MYIYATLLPTGDIKVGQAKNAKRAFDAQTYFIEPVVMLGLWPVSADLNRVERKVFVRLHAEENSVYEGEVFRNIAPNKCVKCISELLGPPLREKETTKQVRVRTLSSKARPQIRKFISELNAGKSRKQAYIDAFGVMNAKAAVVAATSLIIALNNLWTGHCYNNFDTPVEPTC